MHIFLELIPPNIKVFKYTFLLQKCHIQSSNVQSTNNIKTVYFFFLFNGIFFMIEGQHQKKIILNILPLTVQHYSIIERYQF